MTFRRRLLESIHTRNRLEFDARGSRKPTEAQTSMDLFTSVLRAGCHC